MLPSQAVTAAAAGGQIRPVRVWDVRAIARLERVCFGPTDAYDIFTVFSLVVGPGNVCLAATMGGKLSGFVAGEVDARGAIGWIVTIAVLPDCQGMGMGRALLSGAEERLARRVQHARLTVRRTNERAIKLYEQNGYRLITTFSRYYRDGEDGLVMEKPLS